MYILKNNIKGFQNNGNTCYLNAGLQLIIQNKELCYLILNNKHNSDLPEMDRKDESEAYHDQFESIFKKFIKAYYNEDCKVLNPQFIKEIVSHKNSIFKGNRQNDSSEFIIYFLDLINENLKKNIFEIKTNITIKCKLIGCLTKSCHEENNTFLFLDIDENTNNLDDCFNKYKKTVKLEGENTYFCDNCKKLRLASKKLEIISWPKHLIIILKRFEQNGSRFTKNNKDIIFPKLWQDNYILRGFVFHSGSIFGGHYIYVGFHDNMWLMFNDDSVHRVNEQEFINSAYIYYYEKI
jgi:ubiquitin C-terminal hydrolase